METRNHYRLFFLLQWLENSVQFIVAVRTWDVQVLSLIIEHGTDAGSESTRIPHRGYTYCVLCTLKVWGSPAWSDSVGLPTGICSLCVCVTFWRFWNYFKLFFTVTFVMVICNPCLRLTENSDGGSHFLALSYFEIQVCTLFCRHTLLHT